MFFLGSARTFALKNKPHERRESTFKRHTSSGEQQLLYPADAPFYTHAAAPESEHYNCEK